MENERTGGRAGGKRIDERADFGALRNGIAACVVAIHCVHALYTAFPTTAGEVKGHFISPHNGIPLQYALTLRMRRIVFQMLFQSSNLAHARVPNVPMFQILENFERR